MNRPFATLLALALAAVSSNAFAQAAKPKLTPRNAANRPAALPPAIDPHAPTVTTMMTSADKLLKDLEASMMLTSPTDQKQWPELKKYLDVFLIGVDSTQPTRMDVILTHDITRYRTSIPIDMTTNPKDAVKNLDKFRLQNLDSLGIESKRVSGMVYNLKNAFIGVMRFKDNFATIAEYKEDIPPDLAAPLSDLTPLIEKKYDIGIDGRNVAEGQESRRKAWQSHRKEILSTIKKKETETPEEFNLRKTFTETQMDEAERLYVEASKLLLGGVVDPAKATVNFELFLAPLAGTNFEKSVKNLGMKPSRFAAIAKVANPILSGRINFPMDEMRIANALKTSAAFKQSFLADVDANKERSDVEKVEAKKAVELFFAMLDAGAKTGRLDTFVESHSNSNGKNTLVGGIVPEDGNAAIPILEMLPKTGRGTNVEMNVDSEGDIKIHKVTAPIGLRADFKDFFGDEILYVGTSKELLWWAAGEGGLAELKAAIKKVSEAKPEDAKADPSTPFAEGYVKLLPWTELADKRRKGKGDPKVRARAIEAFKAGDDILAFSLKRVEDHVEGVAEGKPGVLRLIGANMAEFTRNLDK